jgi:hypothetical protein
MKPKEEPKLWVTVLKLVIGLIVIIGGVGLSLWLALKDEERNIGPKVTPEQSWGIVNDSPIRKKM